MKEQHDRVSRERPPYKDGQPVWFKKTPNSTWSPAVITGQAGFNSYNVEGEEGEYRRNESHLRPRFVTTPEGTAFNTTLMVQKDFSEPDCLHPSHACGSSAISPIVQEEATTKQTTPPDTTELKTKSGRIIKLPKRILMTTTSQVDQDKATKHNNINS
ncbi:hypothetical protein GE061_005319 [Apolygus lucorum]|uniref:Uncharacterized protein n=1 Tax=Apolygus lucorum TaxID=248454 RepID=A0A8S9WVT1_APOLU|nr:hypothetical protein GE061_005319 [Apolygus lucorum]